MGINYELFLYIILAITLVNLAFLVIFSIYYLMFWTISGRKTKPVPHSDTYSKFAVLIPARNEAKVIGNILQSLKEQTYPQEHFDVWVIVEDINDPTVEIVNKFGYRYFVRDELTPNRKTKGFALQEVIRHFKTTGLHYDAYMIFDADNLMDKNYIEVMNDLRGSGVQVGLGSRAFTNADHNWMTACSAIMFCYMNRVTSSGRTILFHKATLMGTGYFINSDIIDEIGKWIFTGMTEDIQLTSYCYYRDIYMKFYPLVRFYDEQSPVFKTMHIQHLRWVFGYFQRRSFIKKAGIQRDYHTKEMQGLMKFEFAFGLFPFLIFTIISVILIILCLVFAGLGYYHGYFTIAGLTVGVGAFSLAAVLTCFMTPAIIVIYRHNDELKLSTKNKILGILLYIVYFFDFGAALIDGWIHPSKRTTWNKVEHTGELTNKGIK